MDTVNFSIKYKCVDITGEAYIDGHSVEITDISIDAIELLGICDNNTYSTIEQLILEDYASRQQEREDDFKLGYLD